MSRSSALSTPPSTPEFKNTESDSVNFKNADKEGYEDFSSSIVENLISNEFNTVIFDFDGTLTKFHSAREDNLKILGYGGDWFADKAILEKILEKGISKEIRFYIASKQSSEVLHGILQAHNLEQYFTEIHGHDSNNFHKNEVIDMIAFNDLTTKALYLDDDPETVTNNKIVQINDLLPSISASKPSIKESRKRGSEDVEREAGLSFKKWQQVLSCLREKNFEISLESKKPREHNFSSEPINFSNVFFSDETDHPSPIFRIGHESPEEDRKVVAINFLHKCSINTTDETQKKSHSSNGR
jgi:hypothetical protein